MKKLKIAARFIALLCYFAPFETCNFPNSTGTISTSDSTTRLDQRFDDTSKIVDSPQTVAAIHPIIADSIETTKTKKIEDGLFQKLVSNVLFPTDDSISGIGAIIYFDNQTGRITIGLSFLLSFFLLFSWRLLRIKNRRQYFLLANLFCILIFIVDALAIRDAELRWGIWCLASVVIFQLFLEYYNRKKMEIEV